MEKIGFDKQCFRNMLSISIQKFGVSCQVQNHCNVIKWIKIVLEKEINA